MGYPVLLKGDCLELMKSLPDKSVDMVLCDLPYGVTANKEDVALPFDELWKQYLRICKETAPILLFGQGLFYVDLVNSNRSMFKYDIVWDKKLVSGFLNAKKMPLRRHEQIAVFYRKPPVYHPQMTKGELNHGRGTKVFSKQIVNQNYEYYKPLETESSGMKYPTSIVEFQKPHPSKAVHRTEKPIALLDYLIRTYTNEGDLVLDNCMGSGSTGVACVLASRRFIGMEINDKYFETATDRVLSVYDDYIKICIR